MANFRNRVGAPLRLLALAVLVTTATPHFAAAEPGDIRGQNVKGDKDKSANDGWSQAPVPREESASKDAANPGGKSTEQNANRPVPTAGSTNNSASDPQQTLDQRTPSPSGSNPAQPSK